MDPKGPSRFETATTHQLVRRGSCGRYNEDFLPRNLVEKLLTGVKPFARRKCCNHTAHSLVRLALFGLFFGVRRFWSLQLRGTFCHCNKGLAGLFHSVDG